MIHLILPMPISVNMAYSGLARRYKSKKYKEWIREARMARNKKYTIIGRNWLEVTYKYYTPLYYKTAKNNDGTPKEKVIDIFNYEKVLSDFIASEKSTVEGFKDHMIIKGHVEKIDSERNEVEVLIEEVEKV